MRLFHVSEESGIERFEPRLPKRTDIDHSVGLVWAVDEKRLPNFLTPRDCPRVTYHIGENTVREDIERFFTSSTVSHAVIIENRWFDIMRRTTLYIYEFCADGFDLQDEIAGYYVAKTAQTPIKKYTVTDLFGALLERNVELRIVDNLWDYAEKIKRSTLNWSLCRMKNAQVR